MPAWSQQPSQPISSDSGRALFLGHTTDEPPAPLAVLRGSGSGLSVPAERFACANCHGRDGHGDAEGTVRAPSVRWQDLTRASTLRLAYDADGLRRAILEGIDPSGRTLDRLMPGYALTEPQMQSLIAYLGGIDEEQRIGVEPAAIRLGILAQSASDNFPDAMTEALRHTAPALIFGRRIELVPLDGRVDASTRDRLRNARIVATLALPHSSQELWPELARLGIPNLFPRTLLRGDEPKADTIGLLATLDEIGRASLDRAAACANGPLTIIVSDRDQPSQRLAAAARSRAATRPELPPPVMQSISSATRNPTPSTRAGPCALVFADPQEILALTSISPPRRYVGLIDQFALAQQKAVAARHELTLADPRSIQGRDVDTAGFAELVAQSIVRALQSSGRLVTRSSFMAALRRNVPSPNQPTVAWRS
ncbi:c-type cytochrome [Bosea massiliensis]|uniref:C-type cytochrome n=2 Tax=Bosea massiliensis TaxID=151419 RepID=A0ABW0P899_9HYPH